MVLTVFVNVNLVVVARTLALSHDLEYIGLARSLSRVQSGLGHDHRAE